MSRIKRFFAKPARTLFLALTLFVALPGVTSAQFLGGFGYGGWGYGGYGYAGFGFGGYGMSPYAYGFGGYGVSPYAYGLGYGYGYPAYGMAYGGMGYGYPGFGGFYPGYGDGYGYPYPNITTGYALGYSPGLPYAGPAMSSPYTNPLFGMGLTPLGVQSYVAESNMLGRGQLEADRRSRARELLRYGR